MGKVEHDGATNIHGSQLPPRCVQGLRPGPEGLLPPDGLPRKEVSSVRLHTLENTTETTILKCKDFFIL